MWFVRERHALFNEVEATLGDSAPGGEFVADVDLWAAGPHPALELEPCDIPTELIG